MKHIVFLGLVLLAPVATLFAQAEISSIDSLVAVYTKNQQFSGSILVARHGKVLLKKGYGLRDAIVAAPNTPGTIFNIASLTKSFTATLILQLQQQGKLAVSDKLSKYYPSFPNGDSITIHQLLTHTSGIFNYTNDQHFMSVDQSKPVSLDSMIALFKDRPVNFRPGTKFSYCNSGYILLGYIIEKTTGKSYGQALEEMIFEPLGMVHSSYGPPVEKAGNLAVGYQGYTKNKFQAAGPVHPSVSFATGAIYSTVEDLYIFHRALQDHILLTAGSILQAYKKDIGNYGYGWFTDSLYGRQRISHSGSIAGFKAHINRMPSDDACIIVLSNQGNSKVSDIARLAMALLYKQPLPVISATPPIIQLPENVLRQYVGSYEIAAQQIIDISLSGSQLIFQIRGDVAYEIQPVKPQLFFFKVFKPEQVRLEFVIENGQVDLLYFYRNGQKIPAKKVR